MWDATEGRPREEREAACVDCRRCTGPPIDETADVEGEIETDDPDVLELAEEIEDIVLYQDAGSRTDWTSYPAEYIWLAGQWRKAEKTAAVLKQEKILRALTQGAT